MIIDQIAHYQWSADKPKLFKSGTMGSEVAADKMHFDYYRLKLWGEKT
jgi:hypothetical protein